MADDLGRTVRVKIGTTVNTVEDVKIEPHVEFIAGREIRRSLSGQDRYIGGSRCRWTYPDRLLTGEQFWQLKNLVGDDPSVSVIVDLPTQTLDTTTYQPTVVAYSAIMHWPEEGIIQVNQNRWTIPDEGILFTNLVPV